MLGLNQLDAQTIAQIQMQHQHQNFHPPGSKHLFQQNYSFDEQQLPSNYYDNGINHRMTLLQQAQSHSFNMDLLSGVNQANNDYLLNQQQQQLIFQRNNPKRSTLRRAQRVMDASNEDLNNREMPTQADLNLMGLSPQQQQIILMRQQQYSNNSSGQESGLGSSVYTNSAHGTHDLLVPSFHPHHHHHHHRNTNNNTNQNISPNSQTSHSSNGEGLLKPDSAHSPASVTSNQQQQQQNDLALKSPVQLPRRKSLPSIVKTKSFKEDETAHSSSDLNDKNQEIYIIENGIRKRVTEKSNSALNQNKLGLNETNGENGSSSGYNNNADSVNVGEHGEDSMEKRRLKKSTNTTTRHNCRAK